MIDFTEYTLPNGLRLLVHQDHSTPMVAVNMLYNVGARDESPDRTGFAHLFEHLMFGGSANIADFDDVIQNAGGENNAFTNSDLTNFYNLVPAVNLEVAFWLESDRMFSLNFDPKVLEVQRKVVVEEFKETCLNEPYGDVWHHLAEMAFEVHPYRWPTIGKEPRHVEEATMQDVQDFFFRYYRPNNAILVVSGHAQPGEVYRLAQKWFGDIPAGDIPARNLPPEPPQTVLKRRVHQAKVPVDALYMAFHMPGRNDPDYYTVDLLSDVLANGPSSRLFRRLLKERQLVTQIDCYISGSIDPGLFIIEAKPAEGIPPETVEQAIWAELEILRQEPLAERELQKLKNKIESTLVFAETSVLNKAINLAFFALLGDASLINREPEFYQQVQTADLQRMAQTLLVPENCCTLVYLAEKPSVELLANSN